MKKIIFMFTFMLLILALAAFLMNALTAEVGEHAGVTAVQKQKNADKERPVDEVRITYSEAAKKKAGDAGVLKPVGKDKIASFATFISNFIHRLGF